ncbi:MAG: hypothetical protein Q7S58_20000 [Candidatus Binatus sp.]|nr:hypothetical protein [Candidatus Binatus sp.]
MRRGLKRVSATANRRAVSRSENWRSRHRLRPIDRFAEFLEQRGPEVGWNGVVLQRELAGLGFSGSYQQVQRFLKPYRAQRKWSELATMRFETEPGEQAQVDYGQLALTRAFRAILPNVRKPRD